MSWFEFWLLCGTWETCSFNILVHMNSIQASGTRCDQHSCEHLHTDFTQLLHPNSMSTVSLGSVLLLSTSWLSLVFWFLETLTYSQDARVWLLCVNHSSSLPLPLPPPHMGFPCQLQSTNTGENFPILKEVLVTKTWTRNISSSLCWSDSQAFISIYFYAFIVVSQRCWFIELCLYYCTISFWTYVAYLMLYECIY